MLRTILKPFSFLPALIMMYIIFSFSAQEGDVSSQLSYQASVKIVETADYIFDANLDYYQIEHWANKIDFLTRKLAHMTEYFALAVAVSFPLYVYGMHGILLMLFAGLICVGFACGDEYHQSFVAGRGPSVKDVCIDSIGVFFGIIFVRIIGWTGRNTIFRPREKKKKEKKEHFGHNSIDYDEYERYRQNSYYDRQSRYGQNPYYNRQSSYGQDPYYDRQSSYGQDPYYDRQGSYRQDSYYDTRERYKQDPSNPFWNPEQEIDFDSKPEYPEREYMERNDPYDSDWGFDNNETDPLPNKNNWETEHKPKNELPPIEQASEPKRKKKPEKDWFFDL